MCSVEVNVRNSTAYHSKITEISKINQRLLQYGTLIRYHTTHTYKVYRWREPSNRYVSRRGGVPSQGHKVGRPRWIGSRLLYVLKDTWCVYSSSTSSVERRRLRGCY